MLGACYMPWERCLGGGRGGDGLLWHMDLKPHASGDYSIAVVQANSSLEDQGQVFTSPSATYIGVYDGHGGPQASRFITNRLFPFLQSNFLITLYVFFFFFFFHFFFFLKKFPFFLFFFLLWDFSGRLIFFFNVFFKKKY